MKNILKRSIFLIVILVCAFILTPVFVTAENISDPLPSWNDLSAKQRIMSFVDSVSNSSSKQYVPEKKRIAVFDLDGTIFCEKPLYLQVQIAAEKLYDIAKEDKALRKIEPYKSAWLRNQNYISDSKNFLDMNLKAFEGNSVEEYKEYTMNFLVERNNPDYKVPYIELFYIPMLELLKYLRANDFQVYIVSGSPQEFIRSFSEEKLETPIEKVIGDTFTINFSVRDNKALFIRGDTVVLPEVLREGKAENIRMRTGTVPILAFGNSNDDIAMLELAAASGLPNLPLTLHHDDAKREYFYNKGADKVLATAKSRGWVTVSMKNDFKTIFNLKGDK